MILEKFLGNSLKKVPTVGESGEIPHFCYLGSVEGHLKLRVQSLSMTIIVSRHRKWNTDKKNNRELDRKVTRGWIRRDGGRSRGGGGEVKESPKARTRKLKVQNRNNNSKNMVQTV